MLRHVGAPHPNSGNGSIFGLPNKRIGIYIIADPFKRSKDFTAFILLLL